MYCLLIQKWLFPSWINPLILIATWLSMFISCFDFSCLTTRELRLCVIHINLTTFKPDTVTTYVSGHCFALHLWLWISRSFSMCDISKTDDKRVHLDLLPSLGWISVSGGERWWFLPTLVPDRQGKKRKGREDSGPGHLLSLQCLPRPSPSPQHASWPGFQLRGYNRWRHIVLAVGCVWTVVLCVPVVLSPPDCCPC